MNRQQVGTRAVAFAALLMTLVSCGRADERTLFLRAGTSDLPILVRGPESAETLVVFVHGGPGGSSIAYATAMPAAFDPISERHLFASYDQRGAGTAQGMTKDEELTLAQHTEDLGEVVALLRAQYPSVERVVLLGHSWGGTLTTNYLADETRASGIAGWINVSGATSMPRVVELSRAWAVDRAQAKVDSGEEAERWREALAWYEANPVLDAVNMAPHLENVDALGGTVHDPSQVKSNRLGSVFFSPYSVGADVHNAARTQRVMIEDLLKIDLHWELPRIRLPTLLLHGEHDGRVPVTLADEVLPLLGTPDTQKSLVRFERSGHRPFLEEPEKFVEAVNTFLDGLSAAAR